MSDTDNDCNVDCQGCIQLTKRLGSLNLNPRALAQTLVLEHVNVKLEQKDCNNLVACTVNICPDKALNKKRWKTYTHEQQRDILFRIERSMRKATPSVILHKLIYEVCPTLNNIHFHALYECPRDYISTIENFWRSKKYNPSDDWRIVKTEFIYNYEGWFKYIHKDLPKNTLLNSV